MKKRILYLGNKLSAHGFTPTAIEILGPALSKEGYDVTYAGSKKHKVWRLIDIVKAVLKNKNEIDIVLIDTYSTTAFYFAWAAGYICRQLGISYVPILHGGNLPYRLQNSKALCTQLFGNSYINVAPSGYLQAELQKYQFQSCLIPNAINITLYPFKERKHLAPRLLWVRSFHEIYNPAMAIKVLKNLLAIYPEATLTMVGPDKDGSLEKCRALVREYGLGNKISFTGRLTQGEWIDLSKQHDIFLNTSEVDNLPFSLIEAMALGMPVISTSVGGIPYLVNETNGLTVAAGNVEGIVQCIDRVIKDDQSSLSTGARATAEQYDWNVIKHDWINLLDNA